MKKDYHLEKSMDIVVQRSMRQSELSTMRAMRDTTHLSLPFCPWLWNIPTSYPRPPWVIKMERYQEKKVNSAAWLSDPVYSHFGGYMMCLKVYADGNKEGRSTLVSVFIFLMGGDDDNNLKWLFKGTIKVSLLNQLEDSEHHTLESSSSDCNISERLCVHVTEG